MNIDVFVTQEDFEKMKKYAPRAVGDLVFIRDPRKRVMGQTPDISLKCDKNRDWKFNPKTTFDEIKRIRYVTYNYLNIDQWESCEEYERYDNHDQVKLFDHPDGYYRYVVSDSRMDHIGWFWYPIPLDKACANSTFHFENWDAFSKARHYKIGVFKPGDTVIIKTVPNIIYLYDEDNNWKELSILKCEEEEMPTKYYSYYKNNLKMESAELSVIEVIFNYPATIVYWEDGTKTVVKCSSEDKWDEEIGFALAYIKKQLGNKSNYNTYIRKILKNAKRYNDPETYVFTTYSDNTVILSDEIKKE